MINLNCQFDMQGFGESKPLNVGDKFILQCDGALGLPFKPNVQLLFAPEKAYTLQVLKVLESSENNIKVTVASYRAGENKNTKLVMSDGLTTATTNELSWVVQSILPPNQEPKMKSSQGPFLLSYPLVFWLTIAAVVLGVLGLFGYIAYRRHRRKLMKLQLEKFATMLTPFNQFNRDMRQTIKKIEVNRSDDVAKEIIVKMNQDLRLYLVRELVVPAHEYGDTAVLKEIHRDHKKLYEYLRADLKKVLTEFTKAASHLDKVTLKDCEDLSILSRKMAEKIYDHQRKAKTP